MKFLCDLFKGPGGQDWELARVSGAWVILSYSAPFLYLTFWKGIAVDWASAGTGFAAVCGGVGLMIGAKDYAKSKFLGAGQPDQGAQQ